RREIKACVSARARLLGYLCCVIPAQKAAGDCRSPKAGAGSKQLRNSLSVLNCASSVRFWHRIRDCDYLITEILDKTDALAQATGGSLCKGALADWR
ncbi:MAG: hypothetical protein DME44_06400, partial [Verrucomicrobia bacterium]